MVQCKICGKERDVCYGVCFDCATSAEERASKRTVIQHLYYSLRSLCARQFIDSRIYLEWAFERLTRTGDYRKGGTFDREGYKWK